MELIKAWCCCFELVGKNDLSIGNGFIIAVYFLVVFSFPNHESGLDY